MGRCEMDNVGALHIVAHELKNLEQAWEKKMLDVVKTKGLAARDIVDIVQEMTVVQGRLMHLQWDLNNRLKKAGV
jgi:hypothetical protein